MKKQILGLAVFLLVLGFSNILCSNEAIDNFMPETVPALAEYYALASAASLNPQEKTISIKTQHDPKEETSEFILLKSLPANNKGTINIFTKDNGLFITKTSAGKINTKTMKQLSINASSSSKLLVNKDNPLPKYFVPKNLTGISPERVKLEYSGLKLIPKTLDALYSMVDDAKKKGIKGFIINSAYRSLSSQQIIFDSNLNSFKKTSKTYEEAYAKTRLLVALPGSSEHHTGLALDIFSVNGRHRNDFEGTKEQIWLNQNLYKYGFIIRYPKDKTTETSSTYEPWHIRFVGTSLSTYMTENNLCLEEFYNKILADEMLENSQYLFMRVKSSQKVYVSPELLDDVKLETVNKENGLLTVGKLFSNSL